MKVATMSALLLLAALATAERVPDDVSPKRRELLQADGLLAATNQTSSETVAPAPAPLGLGLGGGRRGQGGNGTRSGGNNGTSPAVPSGEAGAPTGGSSGQTGITAGGNKSSPPSKPPSPSGGSKTTPPPPTEGSGGSGGIDTGSGGGGGSSVKFDHPVKYCNVYPSDYTVDQCGSTQPIPACCDDIYCYTNDDASGGNCKTSAPYPGCCEAVNQPTTVCALPTRGSCIDSYYPIPACCDTTSCEVYSDGSSVNCNAGFAAGCCPA